jgi:hypothetical protein
MIRPLLALLILGFVNTVRADVAVLTQHNDLGRTGANLQETSLNVTNVNTNQFGLIFTRAVDDQVYAQPLVMTNVNLGTNGTHNIVIVATVNDSVYAFDADDSSVTNAYWKTNFLGPNVVAPLNTDMINACSGHYTDFSGKMGIVSTPVIDPVAGTIYLVVRTKENGTTFVQKLHALNIATGAERPNSPVIITATYPGTGEGGSVLTFNPQKQNQRAALALVGGLVYITWSSHCDWGPYHGWLMGYDAISLQRVAVYNTTPNGSNGGIWMGGQGPAADTNGNLFLSTGNGTVGTASNRRDTTNRSESFLKLTRNGTNLTIASWFTPFNHPNLENSDQDLGSGGMLLIPGTTLAFSGGKQGMVYLADRDNMGGLTTSTITNNNVIQSFFPSGTNGHQLLGSPVWWDGADGSYGYLWVSGSDFLRQYKFDRTSGTFLLPNYAKGTAAAPTGTPGGILSISANGTNAGSGIVWAAHQLNGSANNVVQPGILRAYNAQNVTNEIWNSQQLINRDAVGNFAKFVPPTVANGKVYLATFSNRLNVYGLLPQPALTIGSAAGNTILTWPTNMAGYTLQTNTSLLSGAWANASGSAVVTNGLFQVTVPTSTNTVFYRLKR